jgi:hypothetical protein
VKDLRTRTHCAPRAERSEIARVFGARFTTPSLRQYGLHLVVATSGQPLFGMPSLAREMR